MYHLLFIFTYIISFCANIKTIHVSKKLLTQKSKIFHELCVFIKNILFYYSVNKKYL